MAIMRPRALLVMGMVAGLGAILAAQAAKPAPPAAQPAAKKPRVFFVEPKNGATVTSPLHMKFGSEGVTIGAVPPGEITKAQVRNNESDMLVVPQERTRPSWDLFTQLPTLVLICDIQDPITREDYTRDPRNVAGRLSTICRARASPTRHSSDRKRSFSSSTMYAANRRRTAAPTSSTATKRGGIATATKARISVTRFARKKDISQCLPPISCRIIRSEMTQTMIDIGIDIEAQHHEVATGGQCEIDMRFQPMVQMADNVMKYKYIFKNVAGSMARPSRSCQSRCSGTTARACTRTSRLWKGGKPLFAGDRYAGLSEMALHAIGGLLKHAAAIIAFSNPTTNSYKRLVPGTKLP